MRLQRVGHNLVTEQQKSKRAKILSSKIFEITALMTRVCRKSFVDFGKDSPVFYFKQIESECPGVRLSNPMTGTLLR